MKKTISTLTLVTSFIILITAFPAFAQGAANLESFMQEFPVFNVVHRPTIAILPADSSESECSLNQSSQCCSGQDRDYCMLRTEIGQLLYSSLTNTEMAIIPPSTVRSSLASLGSDIANLSLQQIRDALPGNIDYLLLPSLSYTTNSLEVQVLNSRYLNPVIIEHFENVINNQNGSVNWNLIKSSSQDIADRLLQSYYGQLSVVFKSQRDLQAFRDSKLQIFIRPKYIARRETLEPSPETLNRSLFSTRAELIQGLYVLTVKLDGFMSIEKTVKIYPAQAIQESIELERGFSSLTIHQLPNNARIKLTGSIPGVKYLNYNIPERLSTRIDMEIYRSNDGSWTKTYVAYPLSGNHASEVLRQQIPALLPLEKITLSENRSAKSVTIENLPFGTYMVYATSSLPKGRGIAQLNVVAWDENFLLSSKNLHKHVAVKPKSAAEGSPYGTENLTVYFKRNNIPLANVYIDGVYLGDMTGCEKLIVNSLAAGMHKLEVSSGPQLRYSILLLVNKGKRNVYKLALNRMTVTREPIYQVEKIRRTARQQSPASRTAIAQPVVDQPQPEYISYNSAPQEDSSPSGQGMANLDKLLFGTSEDRRKRQKKKDKGLLWNEFSIGRSFFEGDALEYITDGGPEITVGQYGKLDTLENIGYSVDGGFGSGTGGRHTILYIPFRASILYMIDQNIGKVPLTLYVGLGPAINYQSWILESGGKTIDDSVFGYGGFLHLGVKSKYISLNLRYLSESTYNADFDKLNVNGFRIALGLVF
jgi:hypothetical protein